MFLTSFSPEKRRKLTHVTGALALLFMIGLGVFAANGWFPRTDPMSGKKAGWFGKEIPQNTTSIWNPFAPSPLNPSLQLSKEYIYAGSRLLAVEDANVGAGPSPTPITALEGDVVDAQGGSAGDGFVLSNDVAAIRAMILGNTPMPAPGSQYQRTDVAGLPCGDSSILSNDVTIVRNYVLGELPLTPACGPAGPPNRPEGSTQNAGSKNFPLPENNVAATPPDLHIRVHNATGSRSQSVTIPVFMKMDRDETAVAFTLEYDTAKLSNPRITLNTELPASTVLSTNITQPGKIGILLDAEVPLSTTPRELRIVFVTFDVRTTATTGPSSIRVTSSLAIKSVSNSRARLLPAEYTDGSVSITP